MEPRSDFATKLAERDLKHLDRAIALIWYYRQSQEFEERTASELANDLHELGFPKPRIGRLHTALNRSRYVVRGRRANTFQLDLRRLPQLDETYGELLTIKKVDVSDAIIPAELVAGTRNYLERLVHQINGCYDDGFYDACAVLCRRLMETLIIEIYVSAGRHREIQVNSVFLPLDRLIAFLRADQAIPLARTTPRTMEDVKQLGDVGAHDRTYITLQQDVDDVKARYRRIITELLALSGIRP